MESRATWSDKVSIWPSNVFIHSDHHGGQVGDWSGTLRLLLSSLSCFKLGVDFEILVQHVDHMLNTEDCTESLVLSHETEADEAIPLSKIDGGRRIFGFDTDYRRLDLGRRFETIATHFDKMIDASEQLNIDRETTVKVTARLRDETHGELPLEHENGSAEDWPVLEQFED